MTWHAGGCKTNGIIVHYWRTGGDKPPVVLLHGLMGNGASWAPLARALAAEFDVIAPDARGHGRSSAPPSGYRYADLARDVVGVIDKLALGRPALLGHSMGGMTAAVAASAVALRSLVLVDPTFLSPARQREVYASDVAAQHQRMLARTQAELVAEARTRHANRALDVLELQAAARLQTRMAALDVLAPPNPDYRDVMRAITVPCLLVIGDRDPVVTPAMAAELCSNPHVRVAQLEDAGHGLPFDQPARLAEVAAPALR